MGFHQQETKYKVLWLSLFDQVLRDSQILLGQ